MSSGSKRPADADEGTSEVSGASESKKKCKRRWGAKSRWGDSDETEKETVLSGLPTVVPMGLTKEQEEQYLLQLQIEEITRRLQTGELGIPPVGERRSPSPEPVYNHEGKRTNTREVRTRRKLEDERHRQIQKLFLLNPQYRPPSDYKAPVIRFNERVFIPQEEHPEIGFIGMIIGPRGNSLRKIEKETGTSIVIRGKGSVKEGRIGLKDGKPLPGADEPLHAYITSGLEENVKKAADKIRQIINDAINIPDEDNDWMREQLRELAVINGTLRDSDTLNRLKDLREAEAVITNKILCHICGAAGHIARDCKQRRPGESLQELANQLAGQPVKKNLDVEYMSLMAELGQGPKPPSNLASPATASVGARPQIHEQQSRVLALPPPPPPPAALSMSSPVETSVPRPPLPPCVPQSSTGPHSVNGMMPPASDSASAGNWQPPVAASVVQGMTPPAPPPTNSTTSSTSFTSRLPQPAWMNQQPRMPPMPPPPPPPCWQQPNYSQTFRPPYRPFGGTGFFGGPSQPSHH